MAINVSVQYNSGLLPDIILTVDPMLLPSGNPFKCHEEVSYLQPMIPPKRFDIFSPRQGDAQKVYMRSDFSFDMLYLSSRLIILLMATP